jgi:hypothetical protein
MLRKRSSIRQHDLTDITMQLTMITNFNVCGVQATHSNVRIIPTIGCYGLIIGATRLELGAFDGHGGGGAGFKMI